MGADVPVQLTGLRKRFGATVALDGVSSTIEPGEVFGYLGPNGAGKTTTIRLLMGRPWPTSDLDLGRPARALSRGNRQKLTVVLAVMSAPRLLVLDEPSRGRPACAASRP